MRIKSKEEFVSVLITAMAISGYVVDTFDFKNEFLRILEEKRYDELFSFVKRVDDLDFSEVFEMLQSKGILTFSESEYGITINLKVTGYNLEKEFAINEYFIEMMKKLIRELDISKSLRYSVYGDTKLDFRLSNPNGVCCLNRTQSIVTDGLVKKMPEYKSGAIFIEEANFLSIQSIRNGKLKEVEFIYPNDDKIYMCGLLSKIINYLNSIGKINGYYGSEGKLVDGSFEEIESGIGYVYKRF